ncbi:CAAX geranylgeranyltransferase alpha subunit [Blastocladiella emersonii ATCC 22665]|nr:CAAX geranylgeranyltransferase alpha subunit [Blastocladiella emersonii ATCC 22665]
MTSAIPYRERPEWADVKPVSLDEGPAPFAPIMFRNEYVDAMGHFLAVLESGEMTPRVLDLTTHLVTLNAGLYSVWRHRQLLLEELGSDLAAELTVLTGMMEDNPKNYQMWQHRTFVVGKLLGDGAADAAAAGAGALVDAEKKFTAVLLEDDAKNYHTWNYRQWLVSTYNAWDGELDLTDLLLAADVRNNSAWTYRFFMLFGSEQLAGRVMDVDVDAELDATVAAIRRAPSNESPWVYLRGVLNHQNMATAPERVMDACKTLVAGNCMSPHLFAFLVDEYAALGDLEAARSTCEHLEQTVDRTRKRYWAYRRAQLVQ